MIAVAVAFAFTVYLVVDNLREKKEEAEESAQ